MGHFEQRCLERGITRTDPAQLRDAISWAIAAKRDDLVDRMMTTADGVFWRFRCPDGIFYTVTGHGSDTPKTVLTQDMMRNKKWARKQQKRGRYRGQ